MEILEAIAARRSIRRYRPDPVSETDLARLLEAARLAPSGTNAQPWAFVVIREGGRREALAQAAYGQRMFREAPAVVAVCGNRKAYKRRLRRGKELVEIGAVDGEVLETVSRVYGTRRETPEAADGAIRFNCAIATENLVLAAAGLGLGACWVMLFDGAAVAEALALPESLFPVALVPVGYPAEAPAPRPRYPLGEVAFRETPDRPWRGDADVPE